MVGRRLPSVLGLLLLTSCHALPPGDSGGVPPALADQAERAGQLTETTAGNALLQARVAYATLAPRLATMGQVDLDAFQGVRTSLQPPLLVAANALGAAGVTASDVGSTVGEFRQLYTDTLEQMLGGINHNLQVYQAVFESTQAFNAGSPSVDTQYAREAMSDLAALFVATEITEGLATEIGQFAVVLPAAYTTTVLDALRKQQAIIVNGVITFAAFGAGEAATRQAYATIAQSLTNPHLLNQLQRLAVAAYGADKVAFKRDEVTPDQPNPSQTVMMVQEGPGLYRAIGIENGKVVNRLLNDSRGLSASDLLYQTTVIAKSQSTSD